jgi:hypothetical protein
MSVRFQSIATFGLAVLTVCALAAPAAAQTLVHPAQVGPRAAAAQEPHDANFTREQLMDILDQYPPALARVLKLDPTLLTNQPYLAPYPALATFLTQHPEVARSPSYFFENIYGGTEYRDTRSSGERVWGRMFEALAIATVIVTIVTGLTWIIRTIVDHRRWLRLTKVQSEVHNKLLDRFTANDELLAYVQSPAGNKFLQAAPISLDPGGRAFSAPFGRILWSLQVGLVLAMGGAGLQYVSGRVDAEAAQPVFAMGVLGVMLGGGFILSALAAYLLSRRLGLIDTPAPTSAAPRSDVSGM